jgi:microcystin-dependent protein
VPDDASGNFSLVPGYLAVTGQVVQPSNHNPPLEDIAAAMTARLSRSGVAPMTGTLKTVTGSASAPAISPNNNPAIGIYWTATGIAFAGSVAGVRFIGELIPYTFLTPEPLTVLPYGQTLLRASYPDLWEKAQTDIAAGNTFYNNGNGATTFGVGDLRGRVVAGKDDMGGTSANRLSSVMASTTFGGTGGEQSHALTISELPSHNHANTLNDPGHQHSYVKGITDGIPKPAGTGSVPLNGTVNDNTGISFTGISINNVYTGGGVSHNNVQPTLVCNYLLYAGA